MVILTGASGSGKAAIALQVAKAEPSISVHRFDTIGVPSPAVMATFGAGYQPGGAWQRAMTLDWIAKLAPAVHEGQNVLFEGQMRIAFVQEALQAARIPNASIVLVDCADAVRRTRLIQDRRQPELATDHMIAWSRYLRAEAQEAGCHILDTTDLPLRGSAAFVASLCKRRPSRT